MTAPEIIGQLTAGLRAGLILLAVMTLLSGALRDEDGKVDRWRVLTVILVAVAVVLYSPAHAAWLLGHPVPKIVSRIVDMLATGTSCAGFLYFLASVGLRRGLPLERVQRGTIVNIGLVVVIAGATIWTL